MQLHSIGALGPDSERQAAHQASSKAKHRGGMRCTYSCSQEGYAYIGCSWWVQMSLGGWPPQLGLSGQLCASVGSSPRRIGGSSACGIGMRLDSERWNALTGRGDGNKLAVRWWAPPHGVRTMMKDTCREGVRPQSHAAWSRLLLGIVVLLSPSRRDEWEKGAQSAAGHFVCDSCNLSRGPDVHPAWSARS